MKRKCKIQVGGRAFNIYVKCVKIDRLIYLSCDVGFGLGSDKESDMTLHYNKLLRRAALVLAAIMLFCMAPTIEASAATADPDSASTPGVYDGLEESIDSLKEQIASLEKIIELNVPRAEKIPVLLYHHLVKEEEMTDPQWNNDSVLSVEKFSEQMKYLYDNKFYTASLYDLEQYINGKKILPERTVVITFDDGYRSNTKYAYPILKKYGFRASIFLITSLIGEKEKVIEHASWSDLKKTRDVFSFHSHSHNLHKMLRDGKSLFQTSDSTEIMNDLLITKGMLSSSYFAYPYGHTGRAARRALTDAGFRMAFTTVAAYAKKKCDLLEVPRFTITPRTGMDLFESICMGRADAAEEPSAAGEAT